MAYVRAIATVTLLLVCLVQWPHAVQSAPPVALYNDLVWNLGKEALFQMPRGLKLGQLFQNVGGANVTGAGAYAPVKNFCQGTC